MTRGAPLGPGALAVRGLLRAAGGQRGGARKAKTPASADAGVFGCKSLTMTYFHRREPTIIGAKAFHVPVRDGKAWDHLAMVVKRKRLPAWRLGQAGQSGSEAHRGWAWRRAMAPALPGWR